MSNIFDASSISSYLDTIKHQKIVFTNGCFDLLHPGHLHYLKEAKTLGDVLIVGLNSDQSVKQIKGSDRPINNEDFRAKMLIGLKPVDAVVIFNENTPIHILSIIKPAIHAKGGDYHIEDLPEYETVVSNGGEVKQLSFLSGYSSTSMISRLKK
jgi:rfaE bifunctional protein nucleotidyltransferase chain/domain